MPVTQIPLGIPTAMVQSQTYALPSRLCYVSSSLALEGSFDGTTWVADPGAPGPVSHTVAVPFIRCPTGAAIIIVKKES